MTVEQHVKAIAKWKSALTSRSSNVTRFETGEGLEKKEEDFAAEVAQHD